MPLLGTQQLHAGCHEILWRRRHPQQFPVFVRAGAVIAMLRSVPDTLCSPDFVNNTDIVCRDDDRTFSSTPGDSGFTLYDDTAVGLSRDR
jgi:hypothetical protein